MKYKMPIRDEDRVRKLINVFGIYLLVCEVKMHNIKYKTKLYKDCIKLLKDLKLYD